jgi:hypothetical protein
MHRKPENVFVLTSYIFKYLFSPELDLFRATPCHLKLANISAIVKCDLPSYSGPKLPDDYLKSKDLKVRISPKMNYTPAANYTLFPLSWEISCD